MVVGGSVDSANIVSLEKRRVVYGDERPMRGRKGEQRGASMVNVRRIKTSGDMG